MQHLILLTILLLIAGLTFTVRKWKGGLHMTFSQHAATNRASKIFYSLLFMVTLPMLVVFFAKWYVPANNLTDIFLWLAVVSAVFQILCTWVPEVGGTKTVIHRILTAISGVALLPLVTIIACSSQFSTSERSVAWLALATMIALLGIALKNQGGYRYALLLQIGYYAAFFVVILVSTYS